VFRPEDRGARLLEITWGSPRRALISSIFAVTALSLALIQSSLLRDLTASLVPVGVVGFLIKQYPNEAKQILGRAMEHLAWTNKAVEREAVRQRVEGSLRAGAATLARACPEATPSDVRLAFLKSGEEIDELPDGTLVVAIAHHRDHASNLARAAWAYARHGVLRFARDHVDPDVSRGIDFVVTRQVLASTDRAAFHYFVEEVWRPAIRDADRLRELTTKLERLQDDELFGPVILTEFVELGIRQANRLPTEFIAAETASFVEFVFEISQREPGVEGPMDFEGQSIRSKFIFVARTEVYALKGPDPYRNAVKWSIEHGFRNVYLLARGKHTEYAIEIATAFRDDPRVFDPVVWLATTRQNSRTLPRAVVRIPVDVRYEVGIGQRLILAIGPRKAAGTGAGRR
jgi:hypothetical protein